MPARRGDAGVRGARWWFVRALLLGIAALAAGAPIPAAAVERWFSRGLYPWLQRILTPLTNRLPIASTS